MLQLVEMEGKMTENGCIEIPAVVLEQAGICTGDTVKLVYMAEDGELKNTAKEFLLARAGQDVAEELAKEENIAFQIPEELLRDAGIPKDALSFCRQNLCRGRKCRRNCLPSAGSLASRRIR